MPDVNIQPLIDRLRYHGFEDHQIAGILGNAWQESAFRPNAHNTKGENSYGLFQWNGPRQSSLRNFAGSRLNDPIKQIDFFVRELGGPESRAGNALRNARTVEEANRAMKMFERYSDAPSYSTRLNYAKELLPAIAATRGKSQVALNDQPQLRDLSPTERGPNDMRGGTIQDLLDRVYEQDGSIPLRQASMFPPVRGVKGRMAKSPLNEFGGDVRKVPQIEKKEPQLPANRSSRQEVQEYSEGKKEVAPFKNRFNAVSSDANTMQGAANRRGMEPVGAGVAATIAGSAAAGNPTNPSETPRTGVEWLYDKIAGMLGGSSGSNAQPTQLDEVVVEPPQNGVVAGTNGGVEGVPNNAQYNADPSIAIVEQALGLPKGAMSDPNMGQVAQQFGPNILRAGQEAIQSDPATAAGAQQVAKGVVSQMAKNDALRAAQNAGTRNQFVTGQMIGSPGMEQGTPAADRLTDMAVMRDNAQFSNPLMDFFMGGGGMGE